ncbi:hypothetical protein L873DRAFT_1694760 [Choiromyces venosus 120613-1]|uniref:Uncharacterized protein n=1 Tax=Choiromyces venosus 120613-1 TaxID=1336337 RepID=A0A3N4JRF0_9PEZI|nr:hypothetical protein L873DRAFT_1694760 [Choiromyces venosus 120613-1]
MIDFFHMTYKSFSLLTTKIYQDPIFYNTSCNLQVSLIIQLIVALYLLGSYESSTVRGTEKQKKVISVPRHH